MTSQRRLILQTLDAHESHPSAEDLFEMVRQQDTAIHLSTIYRTLRWLEQEDLVRARWFDAPEGSGHGSRFDKALPAEHHHFVCSLCGAVVEFDTPLAQAIKAEFEQACQALVEQSAITLYGRCAACRDSEA